MTIRLDIYGQRDFTQIDWSVLRMFLFEKRVGDFAPDALREGLAAASQTLRLLAVAGGAKGSQDPAFARARQTAVLAGGLARSRAARSLFRPDDSVIVSIARAFNRRLSGELLSREDYRLICSIIGGADE